MADEKVVVDCGTGEQEVVPLTADEVASAKRRAAAAVPYVPVPSFDERLSAVEAAVGIDVAAAAG